MRSSGTQQGAALLVVLVMLVAVGLLTVGGAEDSQLQAKMSLNSRHYEQAYYNAESTLVIAENALLEKLENGTWQESSFGSKTGLFLDQAGSNPSVDPVNRDDMMTNGIQVNNKGVGIGAYVVEHMGKIGDPALNQINEANANIPRLDTFRVSAMGVAGINRSSWAVVQSEIRLGPFF